MLTGRRGVAACPIPIWIVALLLFAGAVGKSAQFPLHVWLPDAMEGPTPVTALIHAATMVNAGVYLVARANPIFASAPDVDGRRRRDRHLHRDPRRLDRDHPDATSSACSPTRRSASSATCSRRSGVGAFTAAIFHLMTHGFFKGLLFLGSGSVIHAVHEEQDMRKMGGLRTKIPHTYWTMLIGAIAIAGIPPLAGFFSKDEILGEAFKHGFQWVWAIGVVVAVMTAFYMFRLIGLTFWGESRGRPGGRADRSTSRRRSMTVPLWLLAIPSVFLGIVLSLARPAARAAVRHRAAEGLLASWLEPVFEQRRGAARPRTRRRSASSASTAS